MQHDIAVRDPEHDYVMEGILLVAAIVRQLLIESSPSHPDLRGRCYVASVLLVNGLSMLFPKTSPIAMTGWVLPPGKEKAKGTHNHGFVLVHLLGETLYLDVTMTQFAKTLDTPISPIILLPYGQARTQYCMVDAEPLQESQQFSTAFVRAVSDGSILMSEMWRRLSQTETGFAWDAEQIALDGQGSWGERCVTCGKRLPGPRFTLVCGPHCSECLSRLPGQQYDIMAALPFQVKARSESHAKQQVSDLLAQHGLHGFVKALNIPDVKSGKTVRKR